MMDVSKIGKSQEKKATKTSLGTSSANFAEYLTNASEIKSNNITTTNSISLANAIFAAQTIDPEEEKERKRQAVKRGYSLIEKLETIREAILLNDFSKDKLIEISRYVKKVYETSQDEELNEIIAQIELRIEVELAKLENLLEW
ncbi:MAG: flagellar assembly protein FliX [Alphaproteobacteria bacterium]